MPDADALAARIEAALARVETALTERERRHAALEAVVGDCVDELDTLLVEPR